MATAWRRLFRKSDAISEAIEHAIEAQAAFERAHPVGYALDQRRAALMARALTHFGAALPESAVSLIEAAAREWKTAARAAEEIK